MPDSVFWQALWVIIEATILGAAVWAWRSRRAMHVGRIAAGALFLVGGALFNALNLATGGDYGDFADGSYIPFVRDMWESLVASRQWFFIPLLVVFEAAVGVLLFSGGRKTQLGYVAAIAFHVALMLFGWIFYPASIAMILSFGLLLRAERKWAAGSVVVSVRPAAHRGAA